MASVNKVILVGRLTRDPETRSFPSGDRVSNCTIATSERWKDKQTGEQRELSEFHRVIFRGGLAGIVEQYLRKGAQVYVEGSIRSRKYSDRDGTERAITEIIASEMTMLGAKPQGQGAAPPARQGQSRAPAPAPSCDGYDEFPEDIPF